MSEGERWPAWTVTCSLCGGPTLLFASTVNGEEQHTLAELVAGRSVPAYIGVQDRADSSRWWVNRVYPPGADNWEEVTSEDLFARAVKAREAHKCTYAKS